jgi:hypothetical protein
MAGLAGLGGNVPPSRTHDAPDRGADTTQTPQTQLREDVPPGIGEVVWARGGLQAFGGQCKIPLATSGRL